MNIWIISSQDKMMWHFPIEHTVNLRPVSKYTERLAVAELLKEKGNKYT